MKIKIEKHNNKNDSKYSTVIDTGGGLFIIDTFDKEQDAINCSRKQSLKLLELGSVLFMKEQMEKMFKEIKDLSDNNKSI